MKYYKTNVTRFHSHFELVSVLSGAVLLHDVSEAYARDEDLFELVPTNRRGSFELL